LYSIKLFFVKLFHFEYWPWKWFYVPLLPYYAYLAYKNNSKVFPSHVNLGLPFGGFFNENKETMLADIDSQYLPKTIVFKQQNIEDFKKIDFYPIVAKPLHAQRGTNVSVLQNINELENYSNALNAEFLVQEFISFDIELAVLYSKMPGDKCGLVSSVIQKEFLCVYGNGTQNVWELLQKNARAMLVGQDLKKNVKLDLRYVPAHSEKLIIEPIGNHCRGTIFRNRADLDFKKIALVCDKILENFKGFHYGRFDLKVKSIEDLYEGQQIRILELNGVNADPAHVFDPQYSLYKAYRDIAWHWNRLSNIALEQKKKNVFAHDAQLWQLLRVKFLN
jgi:ATP-grasp domain